MNYQFRSQISMILFIGVMLTLAFSIASFVYNMKLFFHLKKNQYDRWMQLTSIGSIGPGISNPLRWFPYLYNDLDNDDPIVLHLKKRVRTFLARILSVLGFLFAITAVLVVV